MAEETVEKPIGPKKRLSRVQSLSLMVLGAALILVPWFIQVEPGSPLHVVKVAVGLAGFAGLCVGSYYRP